MSIRILALFCLVILSLTYQSNGQQTPCQFVCNHNLVCNTLATSCTIDNCTIRDSKCYNFCARCTLPSSGEQATTSCAIYCPQNGTLSSTPLRDATTGDLTRANTSPPWARYLLFGTGLLASVVSLVYVTFEFVLE